MEQNFTPQKLVDFTSSFDGGVDSGRSPLIIEKNRLAFAKNCSLRDGHATTRPSIENKTLDFGGSAELQTAFASGKFQGAAYYLPDYGVEFIVAQISGRLFKLVEQQNGNWQVSEISISGDLNNADVNQVWMWQAEKWLIISDGSGKLPIFFDGVSCRRSRGDSREVVKFTSGATIPIGSSATLNINGTYTGELDIPVIINGEYYNIESSNQLSGGNYNAKLKNISDTAGNTIPANTAIVVETTFTNYVSSLVTPAQNPNGTVTETFDYAFMGFVSPVKTTKTPFTNKYNPYDFANSRVSKSSNGTLGASVAPEIIFSGDLSSLSPIDLNLKIGSGQYIQNATDDFACAFPGQNTEAGMTIPPSHQPMTNGATDVGASVSMRYWSGKVNLTLDAPKSLVGFYCRKKYTRFQATKIAEGTITTIPLQQPFAGKVGDFLTIQALQSFKQNGASKTAKLNTIWEVTDISNPQQIVCRLTADVNGITPYSRGGTLQTGDVFACGIDLPYSVAYEASASGNWNKNKTAADYAYYYLTYLVYFCKYGSNIESQVWSYIQNNNYPNHGVVEINSAAPSGVPSSAVLPSDFLLGTGFQYGNCTANSTVTPVVNGSILSCASCISVAIARTEPQAYYPPFSQSINAGCGWNILNDNVNFSWQAKSFYSRVKQSYSFSNQSPIPQDIVSDVGDIVLPAAAGIGLSVTKPTQTIGITIEGFTVPASGATVNVLLNTPYSGADGLSVFINEKNYLIYKASPPPPVNQIVITSVTGTGAIAAGNIAYSVPEIPACRMGCYGMGRIWFSQNDGLGYLAGDIVGGASGTSANKFRDAVLRMTENTYLQGGGSFKLPTAGDSITAMFFPSVMDTSLGVGVLQISTSNSIFANNAPADRSSWNSLQFPISTQTLKGRGATGQDSVVAVNGDSFFRANDGISALVLSRREFTAWGNRPISNELRRVLSKDNQELLQFGSAILFDNRMLMTAAPYLTPSGVIHTALASLDFGVISTFANDKLPTWEGIWDCGNIFKLVTGRVNGSKRCFALRWDESLQTIGLSEIYSDENSVNDDSSGRVEMTFELPVMFNNDIKHNSILSQLRDGEFYLNDIKEDVTVRVYYRPDFCPCWVLWRQHDISLKTYESGKTGYRMRLGLGEPSAEHFDAANNRPLRIGYFFQFRVVVTGRCKWAGMRASVVTAPSPTFAPVEPESNNIETKDCNEFQDFREFDISKLPPLVVDSGASGLRFVNNEVSYTLNCADGESLVTMAELPSWITISGNGLKAASGNYSGRSQKEADEAAKAALDSYAETAVVSGNLLCFGCGDAMSELSQLVWTISPELDGGHYLTVSPSKVPASPTGTGGTAPAGMGSWAGPADLFFWAGGRFGTFPTGTVSAQTEFCNNTASTVVIRAHWRIDTIDGVAASNGAVLGANIDWDIHVNGQMMFGVTGFTSYASPLDVPAPEVLIEVLPFSKRQITVTYSKRGLDHPTTYGTLHFEKIS